MTIYAHKITSNKNINYSTSPSGRIFYNIEVENIILTMCHNHID